MKRCVLFLMILLPVMAAAQRDDFGLDFSVEVEKKINKQWSLELEGELRTRNDAKTNDRWSAGVGLDYKISKWLKASAGYTFLYDNNQEELTWKNSGDPKKWTPTYWGVRHRVNLSLSGSFDVGRFSIGLRERWQFTHRPEAKDKKYAFNYDSDDYLSGYTLEPVKERNKGMLRSRLQVGYDIPSCKVDPFANVEMFSDGDGIQKMRYQVGVDYKIKKQHVFSLTYRYQTVNSGDDDNETNIHLIGLGYKYKF